MNYGGAGAVITGDERAGRSCGEASSDLSKSALVCNAGKVKLEGGRCRRSMLGGAHVDSSFFWVAQTVRGQLHVHTAEQPRTFHPLQ
eukprot:7724991-Prorocentrum_lima.AAC.1